MPKIARRGETYHWRECLAKALIIESDTEKLRKEPKLSHLVPGYELRALFWFILAMEAYENGGRVRHPDNPPFYCYDEMHYEEA